MVKVEDCTDSGSSSDVEILDQKRSLVGSSGFKLGSVPDLVDEVVFSDSKGSLPSSSPGRLKSYFVGMGFSPTLVDKVFEENGEDDTELLLEVLLKQSNSSPEASNSWDDFSNSEKEGAHLPLEFELDDKIDTEYPNDPSIQDGDKRSYLLMMNFSEEEVDLAMNQLGEIAPLSELIDLIVTAQTAGFSGVNDMKGSESDLVKDEGPTAEAMFGMMDKTLYLLQMGFTEDEVSTAIDNFGPEVSLKELANSIFASQLYRVEKEENQTVDGSNIKTESDYLDHLPEESKRCYSVPEAWEANALSSNCKLDDYEEKLRVKKAKGTVVDDETSFCHSAAQQAKWKEAWQSKPNTCGKLKEMSDPAFIKREVPEQMTPTVNRDVRGILSRPPYFFYGNVVDISQETWRRLSEFLYATEPEFVNCQFFSAFMRKEGYMHNIPNGRRFYILPQPPMTLGEALPHTNKWWPSWDTRKQLSCINAETKAVPQLCEQLRKMMMDSQGMLSKEQQTNILHQCKTFSLIWVGQHKLSPIEPDQVERILGYPRHHTQICGLEPDERLRALKYCFQTDTLGYYLSALKAKYPDGMRVLSIYSGIGGAEVALHRLGIHLKCVVSVEASDVNRKIIKRWWQYTGQSGELAQVGGIEKLTTQMLENLIQKFGGFDLIIGGNPGPCVSGSSSMSSLMGMDQNLFFEFVRVFQRVRSIMGRNS